MNQSNSSDNKKSNAGDRIIQTAGKLFYQHGIQAVGIDRIVKDSNVSINTMYKYFPSKDKLIEEYLNRRDLSWRQRFIDFVEQEKDAKKRLIAIFDALEDWFNGEDFRGCAFINASGEIGIAKDYILRISREHKQYLLDYVVQLVSQAELPNEQELGEQLLLLIEGSIVTAQLGTYKDVIKRAKEVTTILIKNSSNNL